MVMPTPTNPFAPPSVPTPFPTPRAPQTIATQVPTVGGTAITQDFPNAPIGPLTGLGPSAGTNLGPGPSGPMGPTGVGLEEIDGRVYFNGRLIGTYTDYQGNRYYDYSLESVTRPDAGGGGAAGRTQFESERQLDLARAEEARISGEVARNTLELQRADSAWKRAIAEGDQELARIEQARLAAAQDMQNRLQEQQNNISIARARMEARLGVAGIAADLAGQAAEFAAKPFDAFAYLNLVNAARQAGFGGVGQAAATTPAINQQLGTDLSAAFNRLFGPPLAQLRGLASEIPAAPASLGLPPTQNPLLGGLESAFGRAASPQEIAAATQWILATAPRAARGMTLTIPEPTVAIGLRTGRPHFIAGEAGPEVIDIRPISAANVPEPNTRQGIRRFRHGGWAISGAEGLRALARAARSQGIDAGELSRRIRARQPRSIRASDLPGGRTAGVAGPSRAFRRTLAGQEVDQGNIQRIMQARRDARILNAQQLRGLGAISDQQYQQMLRRADERLASETERAMFNLRRQGAGRRFGVEGGPAMPPRAREAAALAAGATTGEGLIPELEEPLGETAQELADRLAETLNTLGIPWQRTGGSLYPPPGLMAAHWQDIDSTTRELVLAAAAANGIPREQYLEDLATFLPGGTGVPQPGFV